MLGQIGSGNGRGFQLTLPVWGATNPGGDLYLTKWISTHAPRVGSDLGNAVEPALRKISTHAPRVGSDACDFRVSNLRIEFQLTLPVWGATRMRALTGRARCDFNSRSPCGERRCHRYVVYCVASISTHAPRVGSDRGRPCGLRGVGHFNSRSPCGERPRK